jgi:hypothetical protein
MAADPFGVSLRGGRFSEIRTLKSPSEAGDECKTPTLREELGYEGRICSGIAFASVNPVFSISASIMSVPCRISALSSRSSTHVAHRACVSIMPVMPRNKVLW